MKIKMLVYSGQIAPNPFSLLVATSLLLPNNLITSLEYIQKTGILFSQPTKLFPENSFNVVMYNCTNLQSS